MAFCDIHASVVNMNKLLDSECISALCHNGLRVTSPQCYGPLFVIAIGFIIKGVGWSYHLEHSNICNIWHKLDDNLQTQHHNPCLIAILQ